MQIYYTIKDSVGDQKTRFQQVRCRGSYYISHSAPFWSQIAKQILFKCLQSVLWYVSNKLYSNIVENLLN